jgi:predicted MPP superfamily phosphohydrolase
LGRLIIFLFVFFSLYGGLHLYGFLKVKRALEIGPGLTVALVIFMGTMIFAPVIVRISERHGFEFIARFMAYIGYTWMGLLFIFVSVSFALDIYRLLLHIGRFILHTDLSGITLSFRHSFIIAFLFSVAITVYGTFEALGIRTEHVTIKTDKIPEIVDRLRIVQISDVHLGLIVGSRRLERIINRIKAANPDILVSTGDLVDGQMDDPSSFANMLRKIAAKHGKFAITGNHEFYAGQARSLDFIEKAGFAILRGEGVNVSSWLNIVGVDDAVGKHYGVVRNISEKELLSRFSREKFTLLLKHRPLVDEDAIGLFDLQLSGHAHKGQIFPFSIITKLSYPNHAGLLNLEKNSRLYVSRGSGTWGPPIRFLSPPEVTLIELVHEETTR